MIGRRRREAKPVLVKTLNHYFLRQLAETFAIVLLVLTALVWVSQALRLLNLVIEKGRSLSEFLELTGLLVPWIMGLIAPSALFIACVYILDRLNGDSELVVIHASGTSRWRLLRPFMLAAIVVTAFIVFVNAVAMPWGMRAFRHKLVEVRTDLIATLVQEGQFVSPEAGLTVHIKNQLPNGELEGLVFADARNTDATVTYLAERARLIETGRGTILLLRNGTVHRLRTGSTNVDVVRFDEYSLDLTSYSGASEIDYYEPPEKYISELLNPSPDDAYAQRHPGKVEAEAHDRLSNPLYAIAMMLIAFVGMSDARSTRQNRIVSILVVCAIATAVRMAGATAVSMTAKDPVFAPLTYAIPLLTIAIALGAIAYQATRGGQPAVQRPARVMRTVPAGAR